MEITITKKPKELEKTTLSDVCAGTWFKYITEHEWKERIAIKGSLGSAGLIRIMIISPNCGVIDAIEADTEIEVIENCIITIDV